MAIGREPGGPAADHRAARVMPRTPRVNFVGSFSAVALHFAPWPLTPRVNFVGAPTLCAPRMRNGRANFACVMAVGRDVLIAPPE